MKKTRFLLILIVLSFLSEMGQAQVTINEEIAITRAMDIFKTLSSNEDQIDGWRIQIINTDDRRQMEADRAKFAQQHPQLKMTWEHVQPYYQVKVGAYKDKIDLEAFLRVLKADFPRAIAVRDKIDKSEFLH